MTRRAWRRRVGAVGIALGGVVARTPVGAFLTERLRRGVALRRTRVELASGRFSGALDVAFLSDLHAGFFMGAGDLADLARRVNALNPDLVCLVGDLVDSSWRQIELYEPALALLHPPLGTWVVPGNHEYYYDADAARWEAFLSERGVRVLVNRGARVQPSDASSLWIAGVDDLTEGRPDLDAALAGRRADEACLLLSHHPDVFTVANGLDVDLQLSGHTHGGQIRVGPWAALTHSAHGFRAGLFRDGGAQLYVGRGAGVTGLPLRVGAPAELALLELRGGAGAG